MKCVSFVKKVVPFLVIVFSWRCVVAQSISVNFDQPFPVTELQNILEICLQLQYDIDLCVQQNDVDSFFVDAIVGRLFHLRHLVKKLVNKKIVVHQEDVQYLLEIVEKIHVGYKTLQGLPDQAIHVPVLLGAVQKELKSLGL